jgi:hypothetical protein
MPTRRVSKTACPLRRQIRCHGNAGMTTDISSVSRTLSLDFAGAPYLSTQSNVQTLPYSRQRPNRRSSGGPPSAKLPRTTLPSAYRGRVGGGPHERRRHRRGREISGVSHEARDGYAVASLYDRRARTSICPARTRTSKHGCGKGDGPSSTPPSLRANRDPCQGQRIARSSTWPSERGPPRCAQLSASA